MTALESLYTDAFEHGGDCVELPPSFRIHQEIEETQQIVRNLQATPDLNIEDNL